LIIAFLAFVPIRRKNLTALDIGRHLVREGDRWFVVLSQEEPKTRGALEFPIPELLEPYLGFYLDVVRQFLLGGSTCTVLWPNSKGGRLSYLTIGHIISEHSRDRLGLYITPP
jgi:hypothetical protein